jgi:hypothetical protein
MKHCSHIYVAHKAIEFLYDGLKNVRTASGGAVEPKTKEKLRESAKTLQRLLLFHSDEISEASWAPDDVLCDMTLYHTFKLFTEEDFPGCAQFARETHTRGGAKYYRAAQGGGLPYKVDHLARVVADMVKLRGYNDAFSMRQSMYLFVLLSHYVTDAHVPMHCDLRDDPPSPGTTTKPPDLSRYLDKTIHGKIEQLWEDAVIPVAVAEKIMLPTETDHGLPATDLSPMVTMRVTAKNDVARIKPVTIPDRGLMEFMIDVCIRTKQRSLRLFPVTAPSNYDQTVFPSLTQEIFTDAVSTLISLWVWMWREAES